MQIGLVILLGIYLLFRNTRINASPLSQIRTIIRASKYAPYEKYIINQMNLESGYLTNTLSQPPIYNPFSMGAVSIRKTTQIDTYSNSNIDDDNNSETATSTSTSTNTTTKLEVGYVGPLVRAFCSLLLFGHASCQLLSIATFAATACLLAHAAACCG